MIADYSILVDALRSYEAVAAEIRTVAGEHGEQPGAVDAGLGAKLKAAQQYVESTMAAFRTGDRAKRQ